MKTAIFVRFSLMKKSLMLLGIGSAAAAIFDELSRH
jgi:hypothetical protein